MAEIRMSWEEIKMQFNQEWVELVEFDWPENEINPRAGVVRVHAKTRKEFDEFVARQPAVDSAFVYVGQPSVPDNLILSTFNTISVRTS